MKLCARNLLSILSVCMYLFAFLSIAGTKHCAERLSQKRSYQSLFQRDHSTWPEHERCGYSSYENDGFSQPITRIRSQAIPDTSSPDSMNYDSELDPSNHSKNRNDKTSGHRKLKGTKKQRKKEKRKKLKKKQNKPKKKLKG